jgi:hypothetical protein
VDAFTTLAPVIGQVATIFGGVLGTALQTLLPIIARLAVVLAGVLTQALTALLPYIEEWGKAWQDVATQVLPQVIPLINQLAPALIALIPAITLGAQILLTLLIPAMRLLLDYGADPHAKAPKIEASALMFAAGVGWRELSSITPEKEALEAVKMLWALGGFDINAATVRTRLFRAQRLLRTELSRRLQGESTEIFDFGADRCDHVVAHVLSNLPH